MTDLSPGPPIAASPAVVVVVVLFPQQALDECVPGGRIVLGRAPSTAKARVEPLGFNDEVKTRDVCENDAHLFPATFVPAAAAALGPVVVCRRQRRLGLAVGPANVTGRGRPTTFFTTAATIAAVSFFPFSFAGAPDGRGRRTRATVQRSVHEGVQDGMSAVVGVRFASETDRFGRRRRIPQRQL